MLRNRLAVLMAERGLKITDVARETGISRNTITSTSQNDSKMIQLNTLDVLCQYFKITPGEFFDYYPINYVVENEIINTRLDFKLNDNKDTILIDGVISLGIGFFEAGKKIEHVYVDFGVIQSFQEVFVKDADTTTVDFEGFMTENDIVQTREKIYFKRIINDELQTVLKLQLIDDIKEAIKDTIIYDGNYQELVDELFENEEDNEEDYDENKIKISITFDFEYK